MTPERRLNQLEPIVAEIAQKQDRMIGQMGVIADEIATIKIGLTDVRTDVIRVERKVDTTAVGLANLTTEVHQGFERVNGRLTQIEGDLSGLKTDVSDLKTDVSDLKTDVSDLKTDVSDLKTDISGLKTDISDLKIDVSGLKTDVSEIKQTQQVILKLLQDRLQ